MPLRNTSPPVKPEMNTSSSGVGTSKYSPYISCSGMTIGFGTPRVIGCCGFTVQTSSWSCSLRQRRVHVVPISLPKIFDQWPECRTTRPIPESTCLCTRSTTASSTSAWAAWPHQVRTSVWLRTSSVRPCSGWSIVAVRTTASGRFSRMPSAIAPCMPSG